MRIRRFLKLALVQFACIILVTYLFCVGFCYSQHLELSCYHPNYSIITTCITVTISKVPLLRHPRNTNAIFLDTKYFSIIHPIISGRAPSPVNYTVSQSINLQFGAKIKPLFQLLNMNIGTNQENQQVLQNKELVWRRNSPYLYQMLFVHELDWPSLTIDWISAYKENNFSEDIQRPYNMVFGTHTSSEEQNYIILAKVRVPNQRLLRQKYEKQRPSKNQTIKKNDEMMPQKIQIQGVIPHDGQPNRIRHNPHEFTKIASRTPLGEIHIYSTSTRTSKDKKVHPQIILSGHDSEGYAIQWNPNRNWYIIGGSYDGKLSLWDSNKKNQQGNKVTPLVNFNFHQHEIEDVSYNKFHESIFISCDDSGATAFWDSRNCARVPFHHAKCHEGPQYGAQFSPNSEYIFASCGSDSVVKVWDLRNCSTSMFACKDQSKEEISQIQWSREDPTTLWAVSGNKATLWDLANQKAKFVHGGCRDFVDGEAPNRINQLSVNINQPDTIAVVDANNQLHVFQPNENCKS